MKSDNGFTLIEIMVSLAILVTGFMALLYMFPLGAKIEKHSQMTTIALEIAQAKIEEINSKSYGEIVSSIQDYGTMADFPAFKSIIESDFYDPQTGGIAGSDTGIKKITASIFWRSSLFFGEKNIVLQTLISQR